MTRDPGERPECMLEDLEDTYSLAGAAEGLCNIF